MPMQTTTTERTAKPGVAQAPGFSRDNHSDKNDFVVRNQIATNSADISYESSAVIGASLLPFLPSGGGIGNDRNDDAIIRDNTIHETGAGDYYNTTASERIDKEDCGSTRNRSKNHDCLSLLLDGRTSTPPTDGCTGDGGSRQPHDWSRQQRRCSRKRILLRGPPRSGKTSLGMNLAYAEAAAEKNCCGGLPCAAIVYRPNGRRQGDNNPHNDNEYYDGNANECSGCGDQFPLFCRALPAQSVPRVNTNAHNIDHRTKEGLEASTLGDTEESEAKRDEKDSWDPNTLNRIRICRVSSVRDLWGDLLELAGKPLHEQPSRAIVVEDLDQIIGSGGPLSNHNQTNIGIGNSKKQNNLVAMMLKTVAIAADTARAIENNNIRYPLSSSRTNCVTLLLSLSIDSPQQQRDASMNTSSTVMNATDLSDVLAVTSCIDTVVTLHQREGAIDNLTLEPNDKENRDTVSCAWKKPMITPHRRSVERREKEVDGITGIKKGGNGKNFAEEHVRVDSVWQAEIRERGVDQYDGNNADTSGVSLVDYAFVESFPTENRNIGLDGCDDGDKELRWKHHDANP